MVMRAILPVSVALVVVFGLSQAVGVESVKSDVAKQKAPGVAPSASYPVKRILLRLTFGLAKEEPA